MKYILNQNQILNVDEIVYVALEGRILNVTFRGVAGPQEWVYDNSESAKKMFEDIIIAKDMAPRRAEPTTIIKEVIK